MEFKEIVNRIYYEKAKNDSNSRDLARALNVLSQTVFGHVNRFVFELLQNADDSSNRNHEDINVEFHLIENYLIFSHNGSHFTAADVAGISGIANKASKKDSNTEKTGYKGVGFKSVFGSSEYAHIISGGFSFRFDKNYEEWGGSEDYPWQVIPIWTDRAEEEVEFIYDENRVNTIIGVKDRNVIRTAIEKVFQDCQILLFLRRVNNITFKDRGTTIFQISKTTEADISILFKDNRAISSWLTKSFDLSIDENLNRQLNQLSDTQCPPKLKEAKKTKLTFAAQIEDNKFVVLKNAPLYSYLPTKTVKDFHFLINGDFLIDAQRTDLLENIWNIFLMENIALKQIEWLSELQNTEFKFEVLKLLKGKYPNFQISDIDLAYNKSLEEATSSIKFLPEQKSGFHTVITKSIVDSIQFSKYFDTKLITNFLGLPSHSVIDVRMSEQGMLSNLGAKQFGFPQLLQFLASGTALTGLNDAINLIVFFYNNTLNGINSSWMHQLVDTKFIMDYDGIFNTPKEIFFPLSIEESADPIDFENIRFVHPGILTHFSEYPDVMTWLQHLGIREPSDLEIIKKALIPLILDNKIIETNTIKITRFIFNVYTKKILSDSDYDSLRSLKLLGTNGLKYPRQCYLSDIYRPDKILSSIIPNANFVSDAYPETAEDISEWKAFFKKIGVRDSLAIDVIEDNIERTAFVQDHPHTSSYFLWLDDKEHYPKIYRAYKHSGQHSIQNFTSIEFREHLQGYDFSKFFWSRMLDDWENFRNKCDQTIYYYRGGSTKIPSFLEYYTKNFISIPCTDRKCYISTEVFSPALKNVVGSFFPVADLPASITGKQADFFGFKRSISIVQCLELLDKIAAETLTPELNKQLFSIYDQLISQSGEKATAIKTSINNWKANGQLLTLNNTFQKIGELYCFSVLGTDAPLDSDRFIKLPNGKSFDEIEAFCNLLDIPVITFDKLKFVPENFMTETAFPEELLYKANYLALVHSHKSNDEFESVLTRIIKTINDTHFIQAEKLNLMYQLEKGDVIFSNKIGAWNDYTTFYFTGKWNSPKTIYGLSNKICTLLGINGIEFEFALIMQLSDTEVLEWLQEKGYDVKNLKNVDDIIQHSLNPTIPSPPNEENNQYDGIDIVIEDEFVPEIKAAEINFQNIHPIIKTFSGPLPIITREYAKIDTPQIMVDIGRWSEEYIFEYLNQNPTIFTEIHWVNQLEESYLPYDFKVLENGIEKLFEVKGTTSPNKEIVYMSREEWKILFEYGANYSLFRVFKAGTMDHSFERTDNVRASIENGTVMPSPIQLII